MPLLTIGIPTYNRANILKEFLDRIIPLCSEKDIEVLISDDGSTDATKEILKKYTVYNNFRYRINKINQGVDKNTLQLFNQARGEFLWLLGDDDEFDTNQLSALIDILKENKECGLFYLYFKALETKECIISDALKYKKITQQDYIDNYLHKATLISTNVFNLRYFREIKINSDCVSKGWIHLHVIINYCGLLNKKGIYNLIVETPVVFQRMGNSNYSLERWDELLVHNLYFTVKNSDYNGLQLNLFLHNYFKLNITHRFFKVAKEWTIGRCCQFYLFVSQRYRVGLFDKFLFFTAAFAVKAFGFDRVKAIKRALRFGKK